MDRHDVFDGVIAILAMILIVLFAVVFIAFIGWSTLFLLGLVSFGPFSSMDYFWFWAIGVAVTAGSVLSAYLLYGALMLSYDCFDDWRD